MHYYDLSAPLLKLVKFDNLDIFFYGYNTFDLLGIDVYHYHECAGVRSKARVAGCTF